LKGEGILEHLGMAALQIEQLTQALFGKVESVIIVCAILILVVGIPLYWLRLKLERSLIRVIRSSREKRQIQKSAANTDSSQTVPHCPVCNALMVKRLARRGVSAGSSFWGCSNYPKCRGTRAADYSSICAPYFPQVFRRRKIRRQKETGCLIRAAGYAFRYPWAMAPTINTTKPVATAIATFAWTDKFIIFPSIMAATPMTPRF
jgi:ssDNA-binding Zn-finger/Zn-ribbon topoisomerase 1